MESSSRSGSRGDTRTYQCNLCTYHTERRAHIVRHLRGHTGERPFACAHCDRCFVHKHHLDRHRKRAHPRREQRQLPPAPLADFLELELQPFDDDDV
ncbi:zinc finger protein ZIPIC-like [Haemaphysalis longicornis]